MKIKKNNIRTKELVTLLIIVALFFLFRAAISYVFTRAGEAREKEMLELKMSTMVDILSNVNERRTAADAAIAERRETGIGMMTNLLKAFVTEDGYDGPRSFADGVVAELDGERVVLPQEYRGLETQVTREQIEQSLKSGAMLSCRVTADRDLMRVLGEGGTEAGAESWFLSFGEIAEGVIYVDLLSERAYNDYLDLCSQIAREALEAADGAFGGITLALREQGAELVLSDQYGSDTAFESLSAQALLRGMADAQTETVTLDGQEYSCACVRLDAARKEEGPRTVVQLIPKISLAAEISLRVRLLRLMMLVILIAITVYTISAQHVVAEQKLSEELRNRYRPKKLRSRMVTACLLSVLAVFLAVVLVEGVGLVHTELRSGRDILNLFSGKLESNNEQQYRKIEREEERQLVSCGERLASLLAGYPALNTAQKLRESCEALGIESIMVFDSRGRQALCSGDYTGFRLDDVEHPALYDFRRLLYGVPSIIHEPAQDPITGLERQQIGVTMPVAEDAAMHGALIMTMQAERIREPAEAFDTRNARPIAAASGTICFAADCADGTILYSSRPGMSGKRVSECGLPEDSLRDGIVDFATIAGSDYLMISSREGERVCYYAAGTDTVFGRILQIGAVVSLIFAAALALLLPVLMKGYNEKVCREWEARREKEHEKLQRLRVKNQERFDTAEESERKNNLLQNALSIFGWDRKNPGERASFVLNLGMILLILYTLNTLHTTLLPNESYGTMLGFFLRGSWRKGLNLFSLCSILLIVGIACLINILCSLLMRLASGVVSENGETVFRLLYSCVRYVTVIAVLYFSLEYLGFSAGTIIASLGIVSLALSLGAQDLIKDILAGLAIVFDGSFHIGDVVEINSREGVVQEIGVRATKLTVDGNNTLYINNSGISSVLNKSKALSEIVLEIRVPGSESLLKLEAVLNGALPEIGSRNSRIVQGPFLLGVTGLSGTDLKTASKLIQLSIQVMINEKDAGAVRAYLFREIRLLCEREGIELL